MTIQAVRLNGKPNSEVAYLGAYVCNCLGKQDRVRATQAMNRVGFSFVDWLSDHQTLNCDIGLWSEGNSLFVAIYGTENFLAYNQADIEARRRGQSYSLGAGQILEYLLTATPRRYGKIGAWGMPWAYNQAATILPWIERHDEYQTCHRVVIVGHSLGAAVGYMLAQLWYPSSSWHGNIEVLTFGEPKCLGPFGDEIPESFPNNNLFQPTDTRDPRKPEWHPFEPQYHEEICCANTSGNFAVFDPVFFMPPSIAVAPIPTPNRGLTALGALAVSAGQKLAKLGFGVTPVHHGTAHYIDRQGVEYQRQDGAISRFLDELLLGTLRGVLLGGFFQDHYLDTAYLPMTRAMYNSDMDGQRTAGHGRLDSLGQTLQPRSIVQSIVAQERTRTMPNQFSPLLVWDEESEFRREFVYQIWTNGGHLTTAQRQSVTNILQNNETVPAAINSIQLFGRSNGTSQTLTAIAIRARNAVNGRNSILQQDIARVYSQGYRDGQDDDFRNTIGELPPEAMSQMAGQPERIIAPWLDPSPQVPARALSGQEELVERLRREAEAQRVFSGQNRR